MSDEEERSIRNLCRVVGIDPHSSVADEYVNSERIVREYMENWYAEGRQAIPLDYMFSDDSDFPIRDMRNYLKVILAGVAVFDSMVPSTIADIVKIIGMAYEVGYSTGANLENESPFAEFFSGDSGEEE